MLTQPAHEFEKGIGSRCFRKVGPTANGAPWLLHAVFRETDATWILTGYGPQFWGSCADKLPVLSVSH